MLSKNVRNRSEKERYTVNEINQLIKAGKLKYVYSNPIYKEQDCRVIWEKGYIDIDNVEIRTIPREGFNNIRYNGQLVTGRRGERKISTSSQTGSKRT